MLHQHLTTKYSWYANWHQHKYHRHFHWLTFGLAALIATVAIFSAWNTDLNKIQVKAQSSAYQVGIADSMTKVFIKNDIKSFNNWTTNANISLAKNEYESFQVVVKAKTNLKNVTVYPQGDTQGFTVQVYPVGSMEIIEHSRAHNSSPLGWYPDPILRWTSEIDVHNGDYQSFWVNVYAPKGISAGNKTFNLIVEPEGEPSTTVKVEVNVWNFVLPDRATLQTAWSWSTNDVDPIYENTPGWADRDAQDRDIYQDEVEYLIDKYRFWPDRIYGHGMPYLDEMYNKYGYIDKSQWRMGPLHLNAQDQSGYSYGVLDPGECEKVDSGGMPEACDDYSSCPIDVYLYGENGKQGYIDELNEDWPKIPDYLRPYYFIYAFDEVPIECYDKVQWMVKEIYTKGPGAPMMVASFGPDISNDVDNWKDYTWAVAGVGAWGQAGPSIISKLQKAGIEAWPYTTGWNPLTVTWYMEDPIKNARNLMGYTAYEFNFDGFLYWEVGNWLSDKRRGNFFDTINDSPLSITDGGFIHNWNPWSYNSSDGGNGISSLFWPGPERITANIRLANIRDGMEDYEYFKIAECLTGQKQSVSHNIVGDFPSDADPSPSEIYSERQRIAEIIENQGGNQGTSCEGPFSSSPSCNCDAWQNQSCGAGNCASDLMYQTRSCENSCAEETRCTTYTECGSGGTKCGDNTCDSNETCSSCEADCGVCSSTPGDNSGSGQNLNCSGVVDLYDFGILMSCWGDAYDETDPKSCYLGANVPDDCAASPDITGPAGEPDGQVDTYDLGALLSCWGQTCDSSSDNSGSSSDNNGKSCNNNNAKEDGEDCDGSDLAGQSCDSLGYSGGTLACSSSCTFDTTNCNTPPFTGGGNGTVKTSIQSSWVDTREEQVALTEIFSQYDLVEAPLNSNLASLLKSKNSNTTLIPFDSMEDNGDRGIPEVWLADPADQGNSVRVKWDVGDDCIKTDYSGYSNVTYREWKADKTVNDWKNKGFDGVYLDLWHNDLSWDSSCPYPRLECNTEYPDGMNDTANLLRNKWPDAPLIANGAKALTNYYALNGYMWEDYPTYAYPFDASNILSEGESWASQSAQPAMIIVNIRRRDLEPDDDRFWQTQRYATGISLLGDYFYVMFNSGWSGEAHHADPWWFDEWNIDLGNPVSQDYQLPNGVRIRDFEKGVVLVNTTGSNQYVTDAYLQTNMQNYNGPYYKFLGSQDPNFNNGLQLGNDANNRVDLSSYTRAYGQEQRPIGDAAILVKSSQTSVSPIIIDDTECRKNNIQGTFSATGVNPFIQPGKSTYCQNDYSPFDDSWRMFARDTMSYSADGDTKAWARWTPKIGVSGNYEVFVWYPNKMSSNFENRFANEDGGFRMDQVATNAKYEINYAGGQVIKTINQQQGGGQWVSLGIYQFNTGSQGNVRLYNGSSDGIIIADAVKFDYRE